MMAHQLRKAAIERAVLADEYRFDGGLHVVVDPALRHALEERERALVRVEHHLLGFAHVRPHERHAAVAEPNLRHLDRRRHAVKNDDLVAPVELIGFSRSKRQRHIGHCRRSTFAPRPILGVAPHVVVAALVTGQPQLLEDPLIGQPLALRLRHVVGQHRIQRRHKRAQQRQRLLLAHVAMFRRLCRSVGADDVAHRVPRQVHLTRDRLDLLAMNEMRTPHLSNRVHRHHPRSAFVPTHALADIIQVERGGVKIEIRLPHERG